MHLTRSGNIIVLIALVVMLFSSIGTILWGLDKSLGLGDEGVYFFSARFPEDIKQNVSAVYVYTGFLFRISNHDPAIFRLVGMVIILISAFIFWLGFDKFFQLRTKSLVNNYVRPYSLLFIGMGAMLYFQWFFATPNNYTLTAVAVNIFAGTLLLGLSLVGDWNKNTKTIFAVFSAVGLSLGLAFFTKITTGICLALLCFLVIYLWESIGRYQKFTLIIAVLFGMGGWFTGHFIVVLPPEPSWRMFKEGWSLYQSFGVHVPQLKIILYSTEIFNLFYSAIKAFWPSYLIIGGIFVYSVLRRQDNNQSENTSSGLLFVVVIMAVLLSVSPAVYIEERITADRTIPFYVVFHLAWVLLLLTIVVYKLWHDKIIVLSNSAGGRISLNLNNKIILVLLIVLPIAGAVGTANPIFNVTGFYSVPWFGAIFLLLLILVANNHNNYWLMPFGVVLIGAFTASQIIQGSILNPQQIPTYLYQQVVPTDVGFPRKTLKLDQQTHDLVQKLFSIAKANGFQLGDDVVAISYLPSLVFAMGGRSPGHPAFLTGSKASRYTQLIYSGIMRQFVRALRVRRWAG